MKVKKILKWTGIITVTAVGGALVVCPEFRGWVVEKAQSGFNATKGLFTTTEKKEDPVVKENPEPAPRREGRNGGYYKPRYNNNNNNNSKKN